MKPRKKKKHLYALLQGPPYSLACASFDLSELTLQGKSIQSKAREQRYAWFMTQMAEVDANVLMTAHHQDDQLETIFIAL